MTNDRRRSPPSAGLWAAAAMSLGLVGLARAGTELVDAAMNGDAKAVEKLLEQHTDVNAAQADGATALQWAVYRGDVSTARALVKAGASVKQANRDGATPLSLACENGNPDLVRLLLDAGADANETLPHGETALMMAARTGNPDTLALLIDRGANVNSAENLRGTTPLMWAAAYEHPAAVSLLLERGADVAAQSKAIPRGRRPYLAPTVQSRLNEFVKEIGQAGRRVQSRSGLGEVPPDDPKEAAVLKAQRERALKALESSPGPAASGGSDDVDAPLVPSPNRAPEMWGGVTPLVFSARQGDIESARIMLDHGADVNQQTEGGWTPLLTAVQNRYYKLASFLLERGADPRIQNKGGWSPLYIATDNRNIEGGDYPTRKPDMDHLEIIKLLIDGGADVNARMHSSTETRTVFTHQWLYEDGATPFLRAAQSSDLVLMKLLLEHGADPKLDTDDGTTPLMVAAGIGWVEGVTYEWSRDANVETVKMLLDLGMDVNQHNSEGRTALMGAAHKGRNEIVQALVDHGADLDAHDIGSRDTIHKLAGVNWRAIDYADGLVRVGVQSAIPHPETSALLRKLMMARGLKVPPEGRTLESICITDICQPEGSASVRAGEGGPRAR
ncbi:MAG TPA: ankyrin repeat domain-containing protein [Gammaproteobacteria bacterium]|nr:ankyrin repeat domain-containing protein [Gammaproteobacteria bacterium]